MPETGDRLVRFDDAYQFKRYATGQPAATGCGTLPAADKVEYTFDDLGRTTFINYPGSTFDITYTYDNNSNLKSAERGVTKWTYNYDGLDQLRLEKLVVDGRSYTTSYDLNTLGALESMTTPGGRFIEFFPNGLGQADKATIGAVDHASSVDYHPNGSLRDLIYGNGTILTQLLNARQLMDEIKVRDGGTKLVEFTYAYDANGRITSITDGVVAGQNRAFTYDGAGRLLTASGPWGAGSFDYDSLGNIRQKTLGSRVVDIEYNIDNQVSRARDSAVSGGAWFDYTHDARGNVTDNDRLTFTYDRAEQPTSIGGAVTGSFVYDGNYKRAKQVIGGETIYSVYSQSGAILYRDNITTGETTDYIKVANKTVARIKDDGTTETVSYPHQDHLGSPAAATDSTGAVEWREDYTPYGEERVDDPANDNDENFTGHIRDEATGLIYAQARYMDPVIGRFLSNDPVQFSPVQPQMFNRYSYGLNDPVNMIDPDGNFVIKPADLKRLQKIAARAAASPAAAPLVATAAPVLAAGAVINLAIASPTANPEANIDFKPRFAHAAPLPASIGNPLLGPRNKAKAFITTEAAVAQLTSAEAVIETLGLDVPPDTTAMNIRTFSLPDGIIPQLPTGDETQIRISPRVGLLQEELRNLQYRMFLLARLKICKNAQSISIIFHKIVHMDASKHTELNKPLF